jgi:hypothetical protein
VSGHIDAVDAGPDVAAAAAAIGAADEGDEDAAFTVDSAEGHELAWYAVQELHDFPELLPGMGDSRPPYPPGGTDSLS